MRARGGGGRRKEEKMAPGGTTCMYVIGKSRRGERKFKARYATKSDYYTARRKKRERTEHSGHSRNIEEELARWPRP